jgi:predicted PurR-regulated permease PerM
VLGTIICGAISVLLALTQGWLMAILVLAYFILVHIFEGYILAWSAGRWDCSPWSACSP